MMKLFLIFFLSLIISFLASTTTTDAQRVVLPAMFCECVTPFFGAVCDCGSYRTGSVTNRKCVPCEPGHACGGYNPYECFVGSFARAEECAVNANEQFNYCPKCPLGSYQNSTGQTTCFPCPVGYEGTKEGAVSFGDGCRRCDDASVSPGGTDGATCTQCPGGTRPSDNKTVCVDCPAGTFSSQGQCTPCDRGQIAPQPRSDHCTSCPVGLSANRARTECEPCRAGYYYSTEVASCIPCGEGSKSSQVEASTSCVDCPAGTYQPHEASAFCLSCPEGTFSNESHSASCFDSGFGYYANSQLNATSRIAAEIGWYQPVKTSYWQRPCFPGHFSNTTGSSSCYKCQAGFAQHLQNASSCYSCSAGHFSKEAASTCSPCPKGFFSNRSLSTFCFAAPRGAYVDTEGATDYKVCTPGFYSPTEGASACLPCPFGKFSNSSGASFCYDAPRGGFVNQLNSTRFERCQPGSYSDVVGLRNCKQCRAGSSMPPTLFGSVSLFDCVRCEAGEYSEINGATSCTKCPIGTQSSTVGASSSSFCELCPAGSYGPDEGASSCELCWPGSASSTQGAKFDDACLACPPGHFSSSSGATSCTPCPASTYQPNSGATQCIQGESGSYTAPGSSQPTQCPPGTFCSNSSGCSNGCISCSSVNGYSTRHGSTSCLTCPDGMVVNGSATGCRTTTLSMSLSTSHELSETIEESPSNTIGSETATAQVTRNTSSLSLPETESRRLTETYEETASPTRSKSFEDFTETDHPQSETHKKTPSPSLLDSSSRTHSHSYPESSPTITHEESQTGEIPTRTALDTKTSSSTKTKVQTVSKTFRPAPPAPSFGLSPQQAEELKQSGAVASAVVGIVAAPAALTLARSVAVVALVGCPSKNPNSDSYWGEDSVPFPSSLLPGVGFGSKDGRFHRGSVASFVVVFLIAVGIGMVWSESIGKEDHVRIDDEAAKEKFNKEKKKKREKEEKQHHEKEEEEGGKTTADGKKKKSKKQQVVVEESSSSSSDDDDDEVVDAEAQQAGLGLGKDGQKRLKQNRVPQLLFSLIAAVLGLLSPEAGFIFSTGYVADMIFSLLPLAIIFLYIGWVHYRMYLSISRPDNMGIYLTTSFLMKKEGKGKVAKVMNRLSRFLMTAKTATKILTCSVGRFCIFGYYFWTRPKSDNPGDTLEAQRILIMLGSQIQRFRGVVKLSNVMTTTDNIDDNPASSATVPMPHEEQQNKNKNTNNNTPDDEYHQEENPNGLFIQKGSDTWSARVSPFFLLISWTAGGLTGFLSGVSLARPDLCPTIQKVIMALNILCMLIFVWLRPFVVPLKNYAIGLMEIVVTLSSILVAAFLYENPLDAAEAGGAEKIDLEQYHRMMTNSSTARLSPEEVQKRIDIATAVQLMTGIVTMIVAVVVMGSTALRFLCLRLGRLAAATQEEMLEMKRRDFVELEEEHEMNSSPLLSRSIIPQEQKHRQFNQSPSALFSPTSGRNVSNLLVTMDDDDEHNNNDDKQLLMPESRGHSLTFEEQQEKDETFLNSLLEIERKNPKKNQEQDDDHLVSSSTKQKKKNKHPASSSKSKSKRK